MNSIGERVLALSSNMFFPLYGSIFSKSSPQGVMNYGSTSPGYEQTEPVDFSSAAGAVKTESVMVSSPCRPLSLPQHSPDSLSPQSVFQQHSPASLVDLAQSSSTQYQQIRSPLSDASSGGRSFPVTQSSCEDYSDCEGPPPSKMMKPLTTRIRDGRELLQCPTPGCDGKIQSKKFPLGLNTVLIDLLSLPFRFSASPWRNGTRFRQLCNASQVRPCGGNHDFLVYMKFLELLQLIWMSTCGSITSAGATSGA